ncbi:uncharacterized protein EDB93DRAFT_719614 [Suillus bovinus]|uniref:uncharacterized protein n=1 Tax=Suillus bovinus TaxID=48563 RepID=UPI001B876C65|nr:uncharacterized protein EDB93DRAFT_719614 [Suillus bovinus]KAG2138627.1 hypothetical protein EDB93DRAFT_719614 [Suillus bovinus]
MGFNWISINHPFDHLSYQRPSSIFTTSLSTMLTFNSEVAELASALALQAPGTDAPLDVLGDWGREVVRFLTWLDTEERKELFTLTAVSELQTTFRDQVDTRRYHPFRSWGRRWLPLTAQAWEAKMQALMATPVIKDSFASTQSSSLAVVTLSESSNKGKGDGRAGAGDRETDEESPARGAHPSQAKRCREETLQGDRGPSDVQTSYSLADHPSNRRRLPPSVKKPAPALPRMPPPKRRTVNELMQEKKLRDPRAVVLECQRCTERPSAMRPCLTVLRLSWQTDEYELSDRCMRCIIEHQKCEWTADAISKNAEHRLHVSTKLFSLTVDQPAASKPLGPTLTQSIAPVPHVSTKLFSLAEDQPAASKPLVPTSTQSIAPVSHVAINSSHKNTVKATSSNRPVPGPSSAIATKQAKHTSRIMPQLPTPKRSTSPISIEIMELL